MSEHEVINASRAAHPSPEGGAAEPAEPKNGEEGYVCLAGQAQARAALQQRQAPAQADERSNFEAWIKSRPGHPFAGAFVNLMWAAWQARAALAPTDDCRACKGTGVVDDGEIDSYADGTPYMNGPIKCVKDCPACSGTGRAAPAPSTEPVHPNCSTTLGPLGCNRVRCNLGKKCIAAIEASAAATDKPAQQEKQQ
jgi:hypothetical protein